MPVRVAMLVESTSFEMPKSSTLTKWSCSSRRTRKMFCGFKSRWTTPRSCVACRAAVWSRIEGFVERQRALALEAIGQFLAGEQLRDHVRLPALGDVEVDDIDDVGVAHPLAISASRLKRSNTVGSRISESRRLHREAPRQPHVLRLVDLAHPAAADQARQAVRAASTSPGFALSAMRAQLRPGACAAQARALSGALSL